MFFLLSSNVKFSFVFNNLIEEDDLRIASEDEVYEACLRWLNYAPEQRKTDFHTVS
jgi:hypothetical protein